MASTGEVVSRPRLGDQFAPQPNGRRRMRVPALVVVSAPVVFAWLISVVLRWGDWRRGYPNMEATYHSLLMLRALQVDSFAHHLGLPTVTLGAPGDHWIPWGAAVPTSAGAYIYTSFGSIGWLIPSVLLRVTGATPSLAWLFGLGVVLGLACAVGLALLTWALVRTRGDDTTSRRLLVGTVVGVGYLFAPEVLLSQGVLFWPHALTQLFLVGACAGFYLALARSDRRRGMLLLFVSMLLYSATEWSGYVAGAGFAAVAGVAWWRWRDGQLLRVAGASAAGAAAGAVVMVVHFASGVGFGPLMVAWRARFLYRSGADSHSSFAESLLFWQAGLVVSLGLLLLVVLVLAVMVRMRSRRVPEQSPLPRVVVLTVVAACTPLAENIVLLQHAGEFSFDRLKWLVPMVLLLGLLADAFGERLVVVPVAALLVCAVAGGAVYQGLLQETSDRWVPTATRNAAAAAWTERVLGGDAQCATFSSNGDVRGYINIVFDRSVYGMVTDLPAARGLTTKRSGCATVYVTTELVLTDMPAITRVRVEQNGRSSAWTR